MAAIQTRDDLYNYILMQLGHPVLNQEMTSGHIHMLIDDAIDFYLDNASVGSYNEFILTLHIDTESSSFILPAGVDQVTGILTPVNSNHIMYPVLQDLYNFLIPGTIGGNRYDLVTAYLFNQRLELLNLQFVRRYLWNYSRLDRRITVTPKPELNSILAIEYYGSINKDEPGLLNHPWIRRYAVELCKAQWGFILSKYSGAVISGSVGVDGPTMMSNANAEIDKLREELWQRYSEPTDFFVG